jgi:hypothetical protein
MNCVRVAALIGILFWAGSALAAEPTADETARARTFFNAGAQAYGAGKYADAVRSFEQAYALAPRPTVLFSLAQAERKDFLDRPDANTLHHAIAHYKEYLQVVPSGGRRTEAEDAKNDLEARLARLDPKDAAPTTPAEKRKPRVTVFSPTPNVQVTIDGSAPSDLPYFADLLPGKHKVRVFGEGYFDAEQEISGDAGIDVPVNLALREKPALVSIELDASSEVYVDGRLVAETPLGRPIEVPSGPHVVAIAQNGKKSWSQEVVLERAKPFAVHPQVQTSNQRIVADAMLIGGAASVVAGGVSLVLSLSAESTAKDIESQRAKGGITQKQLNDNNDAITRRDTTRTAAILFSSIGAAVLGGGALFYAFDKPPIALLPPRSVEPTPKPSGPMDLANIRPYPVVAPGAYGAGLTASF